MNRLIAMALLTVSVCSPVWADEPKAAPKRDPRPQHERLLKGEDAKKAVEMENTIRSLRDARKFDEALELAKKLTDFRARLQGEDHWEVMNAKGLVREFSRPRLTADQLRRFDEARAWNKQAIALHSRGDTREAIPLAERATGAFRELLGADDQDYAVALQNLAVLYLVTAEYSKAESLLLESLKVDDSILGERHPGRATTLYYLAMVARQRGDGVKSEALLLQAIQVTEEALGESSDICGTFVSELADDFAARGQYAKAEQLFLKAIRNLTDAKGVRVNDLSGARERNYATTLNSLGNLFVSQGRFEKAATLLFGALEIRRGILGAKHREIAMSLAALGGFYRAMPDYDEAKKYYEQALEMFRQTVGDGHPEFARCMNNLAAIHEVRGDYAKAEQLLVDSQQITLNRLGHNHPEYATGVNNMAQIYERQGAVEKARSMYKDALRIKTEALGKTDPSRLLTLLNLAGSYQKSGKYEAANEFLADAAQTFEANRFVAASGVQRSLAQSYKSPYPFCAVVAANLGDPASAYAASERGLARGLLDELSSRRPSKEPDAQLKKRDRILQEVAAIQPRIVRLSVRPKRSPSEQGELDSLVKKRNELEDQLIEISAAASRNEIADLGTIQRAIPADAALVLWNEAFLEPEEHWACLVKSSGPPVWERSRGTGPKGEWTSEESELSRAFRETLPSGTAAEVEALAKRLFDLRLAPLEKHLKGIRHLYVVPVWTMAGVPVEALTDQYTISYVPSGTFLAKLKDKPRPSGNRLLAVGDPAFPPPAKPIQAAPLPPGGLLILQIVPDSAAHKIRLMPGDVLLKYAGVELKSVKDLTTAMDAHASDKSVEIVVWRDGKENSREVPPGKLGIAFDKQPAVEALAAKRKISTMLDRDRGGNWDELPGTRVEVERLKDLVGDRALVLAGSAASEQELDALRKANELVDFRYLHFATHGQANNVRAFDSALILAQDKLPKDALPQPGEPLVNGQISANEVLEYWKLDADLVTLSACETALGRKGGGDGMLGFAQAFLLAGSRSVCLSLWKVDDSATALLMDRFYRNLLGKREDGAKPMGKAQALHEAKQWLRGLSADEAGKRLGTLADGVFRGEKPARPQMKDVPRPKGAASDHRPYAHPRYWAAFILIGDPE